MTASVVPRPVRFAFTLRQTRLSHSFCRPCKQFNDMHGTVLRHILFWSLPHFKDFSIRSSFILFAFTAYNASALARSLGWCGVYTSLLASWREAALYSMRRCEISFSSIETLPIPYTQHSSSFLGFPANFTSRSRHTRADHFLILALTFSSVVDHTTQ
ncbi:hypothetical protein GE21DRAFT_1045344 [Neurospora crassa]|nr:hypothetical protein GE21DRAFT_1045344 [Neurospora crassa]